MNETIQTILNRKSVRDYGKQPVEREQIDLLLRAALAAPSGRDARPWELIALNDTGLLNKLGNGLTHGKALLTAQAALAVCGNTHKETTEIGKVFLIQDCAAAAQNILLAAESLGLGAVWLAVYPDQDRMNLLWKLLSLPYSVVPFCIVALGHPASPAQAKDKYDEACIHWNRW